MAEPAAPEPALRLALVPEPAPAEDAEADPDQRLDLFDPRIEHRAHLIERGPFIVAVCGGCGWESFARRSRQLARDEGIDHELLFASIAR
jgi:hypothetical protein